VGTVICGRLLNGGNPLVKPAVLVPFGMTVFAISQWMLSQMTSISGIADTAAGLIVRGAGLGFLLTPITVASLQSLKGAEIAQGAGLTNLARQLGGSFGIAPINTYVTNQTAFHRPTLVANIFPGNIVLRSRFAGLTNRFVSDGYNLTDVHASAIATEDRALQAQALTLSYADAFLLIAGVFVIATPLAFLFFKKTSNGIVAAPVDAGHRKHASTSSYQLARRE
jgi:DHA2 family multidrug resistance protein